MPNENTQPQGAVEPASTGSATRVEKYYVVKVKWTNGKETSYRAPSTSDSPSRAAFDVAVESPLEAWVDGWSEGSGYSVDVACMEANGEPDDHRNFQSDWQPVMDVVKAWANSPSGELTRGAN